MPRIRKRNQIFQVFEVHERILIDKFYPIPKYNPYRRWSYGMQGGTRVAAAISARLSAGVVVVNLANRKLNFLLLRAYRNWDFPKGIVERGETPIDAALREVLEETSLNDISF